jgi:hypothetical protein
MGADRAETFLAKQVDDNDREHEVTEAYNIDGWTGFDFPGRKGKVRSRHPRLIFRQSPPANPLHI